MTGHKTAARAEQFMSRSGAFSTHGARTGADLLNIGANHEEVLALDQKRAALKVAVERMSEGVQEVTNRISATQGVERDVLIAYRKELRVKLYAMHEEQRALNIERNRAAGKQSLGDFLIQICKERMTKPEWNAVLVEARRRFDAQERDASNKG